MLGEQRVTRLFAINGGHTFPILAHLKETASSSSTCGTSSCRKPGLAGKRDLGADGLGEGGQLACETVERLVAGTGPTDWGWV